VGRPADGVTGALGAGGGHKVQTTGTPPIPWFGSVAHAVRFLRFAGALTLTHNGTSLILPGAANITTAAGDTCIALSDASGNWRVFAYARASGKATGAPAPADISDATAGGPPPPPTPPHPRPPPPRPPPPPPPP